MVFCAINENWQIVSKINNMRFISFGFLMTQRCDDCISKNKKKYRVVIFD
jgi:hypothetical protein